MKHQKIILNKLNKKPKFNRVLLGPLDSGLNFDLKMALEKRGYKVTTLNFIARAYNFPADINLKINQVSWLMAALRVFKNFFNSFQYDIYHFRLGQSLLPWNADLPLLKLAGKKIVVNFDGDDLRRGRRFHKNKYNRLFAQNNVQEPWLKYLKKIWKYHWIKLWADQMTVVTPDLLEFAPKAKLVFNLAPLSIKNKQTMQTIQNQKKRSHDKIIILHVPTDPKIKGTEYIIKAVKRLQKEHLPVELTVFANRPHSEIDSYYRNSDIVVDQLLAGSPGLVSLEGMMYAKPVICYIREDLRHFYPKDLPLISANSDTIYAVLKDLVLQKDRLSQIGLRGQNYVHKNHYPLVVAKKWDEIYQSLF